jgi:hypothetical protein
MPVGVDGTGGAALDSGDSQNKKIIKIALSDCDSDNAFQDIGLGNWMIFEIDAPEVQARALNFIRRIFRQFRAEQRFKLLERTIRFEKTTEGELDLEFKYLDIESDQEQTFKASVTGGGFVGAG